MVKKKTTKKKKKKKKNPSNLFTREADVDEPPRYNSLGERKPARWLRAGETDPDASLWN